MQIYRLPEDGQLPGITGVKGVLGLCHTARKIERRPDVRARSPSPLISDTGRTLPYFLLTSEINLVK